jgi:two-component system chemotaxis response regulator CheY
MGKRVLVVDDSLTVRRGLQLVLEKAGYSVVLAADGEEALNTLVKEGGIDLVITDLNMPRLDGLELTRRIRSLPGYRFVPVLLLTTEAQVAKKEEGKQAGATGWIVKPFQPEPLLNLLQKLLS